MSRTCHIVGLGHLDFDVTANLVLFYSAAGFKVTFSLSLAKADLLVVQRADPTPLRGPFALPDAIHVYDYTRQGTTAFANHLSSSSVTLIGFGADGETGHQRLPALPPVWPVFWCNDAALRGIGRRRRDGRAGHIGHFKSAMVNDAWHRRLSAKIEAGDYEVWGMGWPESAPRRRGLVPLWRCNLFYRAFAVAAGLMYPEQRPYTVSGRMWQGPLNGCPVLSEPALLAGKAPGVLATEDYCPSQLLEISPKMREQLAAAARSFWMSQTQELAKSLGLRIDPRRADMGVARKAILADAILDAKRRARAVVHKHATCAAG